MNPEEHLDKSEFSEAEWLNIRAASAETYAEYEAVYEDAANLAGEAGGRELDAARGVQAFTSIHLAEFERAGRLFLENISDGFDDEARSHAMWMMAAYLDDLAEGCPTEVLLEALEHRGKPIDEADYLFHLARAVGKEITALVERRDEIIENFYEEVEVDLMVSTGEFLEYARKFFDDRRRLNRAHKRGEVLPPESFETQYWKEHPGLNKS